MYGPCGEFNPNSVHMRDGKMHKRLSKQFSEFMCESLNGYPLYRRCDNGVYAEIYGSCIGSLYVQP